MKKMLSLLMSAVLVISLLSAMPITSFAATGTTTINPSVGYQTMNGFGASATWWSQDVGSWPNASDIMKLLYDKNQGIGLNIYRYNLGAGTKNDPALSPQHSTESFLNADGSYNWSNDANARTCLYLARCYNNNLRVTLSANSAPINFTINGKGYGDYNPSGYFTNLDASMYPAYAKYLIDCATQFTSQGYRVKYISPINEPEWPWQAYSNGGASQEGCYYTPQQCHDFYVEFVNQIKQSGINSTCKIQPLDGGQVGSTEFTQYLKAVFEKNDANKVLTDYFDNVAVHSYWVDGVGKAASANYVKHLYPNLKPAVTEYCQMSNDGASGVYDLVKDGKMSSGLTMPYALAMSNIIYTDLTTFNVDEWDWWTACGYGGYTDGLVYVNSANHSDVQTSKRLWALGNFSKFTDEGSVRILTSLSDGNSNYKNLAFKNPDGTITAIYINNESTAKESSINLDGYNNFTSYVTDANNDLNQAQSGSIGAGNSVTIPAYSVTTVVLQPGSVAAPPAQTAAPAKATVKVKTPGKTSIKKIKAGKKSFKVTYKKKSATGYQIQYSTSKKFTKKTTKKVTVKGSKNTSKTIKKLKGNKKYYVRVRTYNKKSGKVKYAKWCKVKTVKTKK